MKIIKILTIISLIINFSNIYSENLTITKKKRVSPSSIKRSIANNLADIISIEAKIIEINAQLQQTYIKMLNSILYQDSSYINKLNVTKLESLDKKILDYKIDISQNLNFYNKVLNDLKEYNS